MLVIAPKSLLRNAWEADARRYTPHLKVSCAYAENRAEAFAANADIYVTNHDATKWLAKQPASFWTKFDYLVIDESDAFRHPTSQRSKALTKIVKHFKWRCCMTGTPNPKSVMDLWNQVFLVDDGKRLGTSYYAFRSQVQVPTQVGPGVHMVQWEDRPGIEPIVSKLVADISIRHKLEDCHDLPDNIVSVQTYTPPKKVITAYETMRKAKVAELKSGLITAVNKAVAVNKLLQICSGAVYDDRGEYHVIDNERYELVADLVEQRKHSIVFFLWQHQRDLLIEEFKKRGLTYTVLDGSVSQKQKTQSVDFFQAGFYRVVLAHPKSAAHGLTMTKGTATIWPSPTYDLGWWIQGNRRIYRAGQKQKTETISVIAEGTREEYVYEEVLGGKSLRMDTFLEGLNE